MNRRRLMLRNASGSGGILPPEYQQVEWIQNTNKAFFGLSGLHPDGIDITLSVNEYELGCGAFGYYTPSDSFEMQSFDGGTYLYYGKPTLLSYNLGSVIANPTNIQILERKLYVNSTYVATANNAPTNPDNRNFGVFCLLNSRNENKALNGTKIYKMKLYQEGGLIADLVPCYRKYDSAVGMYDTVSQTFFTKAGFTKGADV